MSEEEDYAEGEPPPPRQFLPHVGVLLVTLPLIAFCGGTALWWVAQFVGMVRH